MELARATLAARLAGRPLPPVPAVPGVLLQRGAFVTITERGSLPDPGRLVVGRDGLIVRRGGKIGVLLPQVATEHRWGPEAFLAAACRKAGLAPEAWHEDRTEVLTFQADVFGESGSERHATREGEG